MSENTVLIRSYTGAEGLFPINEREVWRYSGYRGPEDAVDEELRRTFDQVVQELKDAFTYKVCYRRLPVEWEDGVPGLPFGSESKDLRKCLEGSSEIVIFAATVGLAVDRYIAKYKSFLPTKALLMQAYGAERVERLCDLFCGEIRREAAQEGLRCTPRFSPGFGDLPLTVQRDVFRLLDCDRKLGISLNESLLMTPSKSVTAVFGLGADVRRGPIV